MQVKTVTGVVAATALMLALGGCSKEDMEEAKSSMEDAASSAAEMAEGAITHSCADLAVSITGIAGPSGGSDEKPVGLVHFGCLRRGQPSLHDAHVFSGTRAEIRADAVRHAIRMLMSLL